MLTGAAIALILWGRSCWPVSLTVRKSSVLEESDESSLEFLREAFVSKTIQIGPGTVNH